MNIKIYQSYYENSQLKDILPAFIPFNGVENKESELLREYIFWKEIYSKEDVKDSHWGLVSWRWLQKTKLDGQEFKDWITSNPGYDVYFIDPNLEVSTEWKNLWIQGDRWHPGMKNYCNKLFEKLGLNETVDSLVYETKHFSTCSYFIGNDTFWSDYFKFVDNVIEISKNDPELNDYLLVKRFQYNGLSIPHFSFVIERLFSLYLYMNKDVNALKFPIEHECYKKLFGHNHQYLLNSYKRKTANNNEDEYFIYRT